MRILILLLMSCTAMAQSFVYQGDSTTMIHTYEGQSIKRGNFVFISESGSTATYLVYHFHEISEGLVWQWLITDQDGTRGSITMTSDKCQAYQYEVVIYKKGGLPWVLFFNRK